MKWWHKLTIVLCIAAIYLIYWYGQQAESYPDQYKIENFPLVAQPDEITCGPASATMLLRYYGRTVTVEEVKTKTQTTWFNYKGKPVGATLPHQLKTALDAFDFDNSITQSNLDQLKYCVSQNRPPIVLLRSGKRLMHWVVVIGYDAECVVLADPGDGSQYPMDSDVFLHAWNFSGDMNGTQYGKDFYHFLIVVSEQSSNTCVVPKYPRTTQH